MPWEKEITRFHALLGAQTKEAIYRTAAKNRLTLRELQCLSYFSSGKTAKEIARILSLSPRVVETHLDNIRLKTACQTKQGLSQWFRDKFKPFLGKESFVTDALRINLETHKSF